MAVAVVDTAEVATDKFAPLPSCPFSPNQVEGQPSCKGLQQTARLQCQGAEDHLQLGDGLIEFRMLPQVAAAELLGVDVPLRPVLLF